MELRGKNVLFLGSSVTYGFASDGISFADIMVEKCGINSIKEAVSGTTLADTCEASYVARLKKVDTKQNIDLFICQLSTNDVWRKIPPAETEKAIRFIIDYVRATFKCPIVFYTGTFFKNEAYKNLVELLKNLQKEYGFYILNLWDDPEMLAVKPEDFKRYMKTACQMHCCDY